MMHVTGLGGEAFALVQNNEIEPSPQLIKLWHASLAVARWTIDECGGNGQRTKEVVERLKERA